MNIKTFLLISGSYERGRQISDHHKVVQFHSPQLLLYLERVGITKFSDVRNENLLDYFQTDRFKNRNLKGFQTELCVLKKFLRFATDAGYTACKTLPYALPKIRQSRNKIITTIDEKVEADLLEDEPDSLVNKRDQAILLLRCTPVCEAATSGH